MDNRGSIGAGSLSGGITTYMHSQKSSPRSPHRTRIRFKRLKAGVKAGDVPMPFTVEESSPMILVDSTLEAASVAILGWSEAS